MAQTAVPIATTDNTGSFVDEGGGSTNIHLKIDEGTAAPNDADYVESPAAPSSAVVVFQLTSLTDPVSSSNHVLRARACKDLAAGAQINMTVELRQGYVSEASQGTLIATLTQNDLDENFTTYTHTLSAGEADSITDYTDLYARVVATQV